MSKVKLTLPGLEIPVTGKQVTFSAPCDCSSVECLQINGVDYCVVDALGRQVTGTTGGGVWAKGAKVSVILDCEDKKAYLQNASAVKKSGDTMTGVLTVETSGKAAINKLRTYNGVQYKSSFGVGATAEGDAYGILDIQDVTNNGNLYGIAVSCVKKKPFFYEYTTSGVLNTKDILHTGNMSALLSVHGNVATGSYVGTGTYGSANKNSIVCDFKPKMIAIYSSDSSYGGVWVVGMERGTTNRWSSSHVTAKLSWNDNGVSWFVSGESGTDNTNASYQLNATDTTYRWVAIG